MVVIQEIIWFTSRALGLLPKRVIPTTEDWEPACKIAVFPTASGVKLWHYKSVLSKF